jgi:hypothetical protein
MSKNSHGMDSNQAGAVKNAGHAAEVTFNSLFGQKSTKTMNFSGAGADCLVSKPNYTEVLGKELNVNQFTVSLKAGKTWQFHLGVLPELSDKDLYISTLNVKIKGSKNITCGVHSITWENQLKVLKSKSFWDQYFKKGELLCYFTEDEYFFFKMDDVINFIISNFSWRLLETGRIKGDILDKNNKLQKGRITFEFRDDDTKKCFVLGAHGGQNGHKLFLILKDKLKYVKINPKKGQISY